jgi:hypothetical protein
MQREEELVQMLQTSNCTHSKPGNIVDVYMAIPVPN